MPPLVREMVALTIGDLAHKAMIAQKAKVPTYASGKLPVGTAGTPRCIAKQVAQTGVGDARDREGRIAENRRSEVRGQRSEVGGRRS